MSEYHLSLIQRGILERLRQSGDWMPIQEAIAAGYRVPNPAELPRTRFENGSRSVSTLAERGLVEKRGDPTRRGRWVLVRALPAGELPDPGELVGDRPA